MGVGEASLVNVIIFEVSALPYSVVSISRLAIMELYQVISLTESFEERWHLSLETILRL